MPKPNQMSLLHAVAMPAEYIPPTKEAIDEYGKAVSQAMQQKFETPPDFQKEFTRGFTNFVNVITHIHARHLSERGSHDS